MSERTGSGAMMLKLVSIVGCSVLVVAAAGGAAADARRQPGFKTDQPPMLRALASGATVDPIITVGEQLRSGYTFEAIPDGIAVVKKGRGRATIYVNHETSTVPFPYDPEAPEASFGDFKNAELSRLRLQEKKRGVVVKGGSYVIDTTANWQRFCSNFLATKKEDFDYRLLFTNEEATDFVYRTGQAWPTAEGDPAAEQAGVVVAYNPRTKEHRGIYGMGRHNHENSVAIPGYGKPVVVSGDDTFSAPSSQLYMYIARNTDAVWNDRGHLWAFKSDDDAINDYGDLSGDASVSGQFIRVPDEVARADQTALETWSNDNNVFQFIRIEDIAYDRKNPNVFYFADTGEPRAIPDEETGRLQRGPSGTEGPYPNGRLFRMELDEDNPRQVADLSILIDADTGGYDNPDVIHQPDNLETTRRSLLIQEDPGSHNQSDPGAGPNARVWLYRFGDGSLAPVAEVDQSQDPEANAGAWESSGIVDASKVFGKGAFLLDVQAHTLFVETAPGPDLNEDGTPDWTLKREGGQLLLLRLPGA
jgi:Bacterial protein of unknown function (DUF839)